MPTAQSLMDKALRALGALRLGASAASSQQTEALGVLNAMIDRWLTDSLSVYQILQTSKTLTASVGSYTVYSGGDINIARPVDIEATSFIRWEGQDTPLTKLTRQEYNAIIEKSGQGQPEAFFYDDAYPHGVLYFYPVPDRSYVVYIDYWGQLSTFATAGTDVSLPPGYESALWQNLALELWPMYPNPNVLAMVTRSANLSKAAIQKVNVRVPILRRTFGGSRYNVMSDG